MKPVKPVAGFYRKLLHKARRRKSATAKKIIKLRKGPFMSTFFPKSRPAVCTDALSIIGLTEDEFIMSSSISSPARLFQRHDVIVYYKCFMKVIANVIYYCLIPSLYNYESVSTGFNFACLISLPILRMHKLYIW